MRRNQVFQSKYFKTEDLDGQARRYVIERASMELIQSPDGATEEKAVLRFEGMNKGFVLNRTNWDMLEAAFGGESDNWIGREIVLYPTTADFKGKNVPATRIRLPKAGSRPTAPLGATRSAPPAPVEDDGPPLENYEESLDEAS